MQSLHFVVLRKDPEDVPLTYDVKGTAIKYFIPDFNEVLVKQFIAQSGTPSLDDLLQPVHHDGHTYLPNYLGSTSAKSGNVYYVREEDAPKLLATFPELYQYRDDVYRQMRALAPHGETYGYVEGKIRVKIVPEGTVVHDIILMDGHSVVESDFVPRWGNAIELRATFNHFNVWHRMKWAVIEPAVIETTKRIREDIANGEFDDLVTVIMRLGLEDELRQRFISVAPQLARHPFFRDNVSEIGGRIMASNSTAPYISNGDEAIGDFMAVPYYALTLPLGEKFLIGRQPVISPRSIAAVEGSGALLPNIVRGAVVYTFTGKTSEGKLISIKAAATMLDAKLGADIVTCDKNVKIGHCVDVTLDCDGVFTIIQRFAVSSLLGIPWDMLKAMNGDGDGDLIFVIHCLLYMMPFWEEAQRLSKKGKLFKFPKAKEKVAWTPTSAMQMIRNNMLSDMGWSTMLQFWYWSMGEDFMRDTAEELYPFALGIWNAMGMREDPPKCSVEGIDQILTLFIQYNIDAQKSIWCDPERTRRAAAKFQSKILRLMGNHSSGYTAFKRGKAYRTTGTCFVSELDPAFVAAVELDSKLKQTWTWKMAIPDSIDGVPVKIYRLVRDDIGALYKKFASHSNDPLDHRTFASWAPDPGKEFLDHGYLLTAMYRKHISRMEAARQTGDFHPELHEETHVFRMKWQETVNKYLRDNQLEDKRMFVAQGLWRASHLQPEQDLSGAVFVGMTEEAYATAQGWKDGIAMCRCILIGVKAMWQDHGLTPPSILDNKVEVFVENGLTYVMMTDGTAKGMILKCAAVDNKTVKLGYRHPQEGLYHMKADILPVSTAFSAAFEPI